MKRVQSGDFSKLSLLYERYHRDLFGYFYRLTRDGAKSEDMVQILFYRLLKYRHSFKGKGKFVYWMYAVAKNVWLDAIQRKDPTRHTDEVSVLADKPSYEKNADELLEVKERKELLESAMQQLSPDKREAIVLSRFQGLKYKEIAALSGCTENTIKSRIKRGLEELREIILRVENTSL